MRPTPTSSTMLQQNNNNNYPCLNVSGSTRDMLQKCSRASLPFPSRLELGLGDLPLIRGLRAWALCSKNRRKPPGLLGAGQQQAPTAPPPNAGRSGGGMAPCHRPADVYLSGEWGRMGYGIPLGLDAGQAGIGALVTVATLKTSEGSGKTQTQCLFLRTEKGSCLYSTAKPSSGSTTGVVGGWLRGKTGVGEGRETLGGRRDNGPNPPQAAQTGANRVRVRSGRRWRKSCNAGVSRERQQRSSSSRVDPAGGIPLEERQEGPDKGSQRFPSSQQDNRRARQEKESPQCCHDASPKACAQCQGKEQRRDSPVEQVGDERSRREVSKGEVQGMRREMPKNEEEGGLGRIESSNSVLAVPNPDLESKHIHTESHRITDEIREDESKKELKTVTGQSGNDCSERVEGENSKILRTQTEHEKDFTLGHSKQVTDDLTSQRVIDERKPCGERAANGFSSNGFSDHTEADEGSKKETESLDRSVNQTCVDLSVVSNDQSVLAVSPESSAPIEGSTCKAEPDLIIVVEEVDPCGRLEQPKLDDRNPVNESFSFKDVENSSELEEEASSPLLQHSDTTTLLETDKNSILTESFCGYNSKTELNGTEGRDESVWVNKEEGFENIEGVNPDQVGEAGEIRGPCAELDSEMDNVGKGRHAEEDDINHSSTLRGVDKGNCAVKDNCRLQENDAGDTCGQTSFAHVRAIAESCTANVISGLSTATSTTPAALAPANPAPTSPPLGSMATGLPCLEAESEKEKQGEEWVEGGTPGDADGGREGTGESEEQWTGPTVAAEESRTKEEEEEEEEEDEFGGFMQAEGEPAWSEASTGSSSVPCGSRESAAHGDHWTPGWTDSSFHQSDDSWTAFPQDHQPDEGPDVLGQWWPTRAVDESRDRLLDNHNLASVLSEAFPSPPGPSSFDPDTVPTLTALLRGSGSQDQGLLDSFHDLNKMICQRYKRASGVSRDLLLKTLHLDQPHIESRAALRTANRRLSPGLPSANQHAQSAAAKRRLSYDCNRNVME